MVATNAGGLRFLRYGGMRDQVQGLEAVLADGTVVSHLGGLAKDNTGYDWTRLLCASEGTLAVVTAARLRLVPPHRRAGVGAAGVRRRRPRRGVGVVTARRGGVPRRPPSCSWAAAWSWSASSCACPDPSPTTTPPIVLVECAASRDPTEELAEAVVALDGVVDVAVADRGRYEVLWGYRERHTEAINLLGPPHKLDVTLPAGRLADFIERVPAVVSSVDPDARTWLFGHVADGNIHVNITGPAPDDERTDGAVLGYVAVPRRQHLRRARHRHRQEAVPPPQPQRRRARR